LCCGTVVLSVCNIGVLWPNGWMDQDTTRYLARPRPGRHCVRWGPSSPMERGTAAPPAHFSPHVILAHVYCGHTIARCSNCRAPFTLRLGSKSVIEPSRKIPPHFKCVATLPCEMFGNSLWLRGPIHGHYPKGSVTYCKVSRLSTVSCAETAEAFDLSFGSWTRVGQRKHQFSHIR